MRLYQGNLKMINFYSNMSFDEMMKEISYENYDFYVELQYRIDQKTQNVLDKIESEQDDRKGICSFRQFDVS